MLLKCWNKKESLNTGNIKALKGSKYFRIFLPHHTEQRYFSISILANILPFNFLGLLILR
nr:MAG TPA: hypothetical protein [Caudoviricetes sp.]